MLYVYDQNRKKIGLLENAINISVSEKLNKMNFLNFELPLDDKKNNLCFPFGYVSYTEQGDLYRILPHEMHKTDMGTMKYECEHCITTLADNVMFGWHEIGNKGIYTKDCINYILSKQLVKNWKLGKCDFNRQFQYGWEQENLLSALFSITNPINEPFMWQFDTSSYPWTINLVRLPSKDINSKDVITFGKNLLTLNKSYEKTSICTRIYPLGYGEGVNQLTIKSINNDIPYIQSPPEIVAKYGIVEKIWTDRRYEDVESLYETGKKILEELQEPMESYSIDVSNIDAKIGDIVRIMDYETGLNIKTHIIEMVRNYSAGTVKVTIANRTSDIAKSIANLTDRQRIETSYAQGATQIYSKSLQTNASPQDGAELNFYLAQEMRYINKILLKIKKESFRSYSKATESGGYQDTPSTTEYGGSEIPQLGVDQYTPGYYGGHNHAIPHGTPIWDRNGNYVAAFEQSGQHIHKADRLPAHAHQINIDIRPHSHDIEPGIFRFGYPRNFTLYCNGEYIQTFSSDTQELDITNYLLDKDKTISRNSWHSIKIVPNDLAYISIDLYVQGFVQSRGGVTA